MALSFYADLMDAAYTSGTGYKISAVAVDANNIYTTSSQTRFRVYDLKTLSNTFSTTGNFLSTGVPTDVTLLTSASALVTNPSGADNGFKIVDLTTGFVRTIGLTGSTVSRARGQQVAYNGSVAMIACNTAGSVKTFTLAGELGNTYSPAGLSGQTPTCVVTKEGNFLVGTDTRRIHEITPTGTIVQTFTVPLTPNVGTTPAVELMGLSYYNDLVLCSTDSGVVYLIKWSTQTILDSTFCIGSTVSQLGFLMCQSVSGHTIVTTQQCADAAQPIFEVYFGNGEILYEESFYSNVNTSIRATGISLEAQKAWVLTNGSAADGYHLRMFNINTGSVLSPTRAQDPPTVDVASRIIRIRNGGVGKASIEYDGTVGAGELPVPASQGKNYIEISIQNSKWDVRKFRA